MKSIRRSFMVLSLLSAVVLAVVLGAVSVSSIVAKTDADTAVIMNLSCANEAAKIDMLLERVEEAVNVEAGVIQQDIANPNIVNNAAWRDEAERLYSSAAKVTDGVVAYFARIEFSDGVHGFYCYRDGATGEFVKIADPNDFPGEAKGVESGWDDRALREGRSTWVEPVESADSTRRVASYVTPIMVDGRYRGVIGMGIDFDRVIHQVASISAYETGYGFLTDPDGNVMYHPNIPTGTNLSQDDEDVPEVDNAIAAGTTTAENVVVYRYHGADKRMAFHLLRNEMRLVLSVSADELYGARNQLVITLVIVSAVAAAVCAMVTGRFARRALRPLDELTDASERAAEGDANARMETPDVREVQRLAEAHNKIVDRLNEQMAYIDGLAYLDPLTGLPNRNAYYRAVRMIDEDIATGELRGLTLVMLDVNDLKVVNDEQGHDAGDELLKTAARQMSDTFGGHPVYRIGGDEFVVIIGETIADACFVVKGDASIACGGAVYRPGEDTCVADVLARADEAMYERKRQMKAARSDG